MTEDEEVESNVPQTYAVTLNKREVVEETFDPFDMEVDEARALGGLSKSTKQRMTRTLKKFGTGVGGAGTKQIKEEPITGYDIFKVVTPPHNMEAMAKIYEMSAPHYAAVNAKVANIVGLGYTLVESKKTHRRMEDIAEEKNEKKREEALRRFSKKIQRAKEDVEEYLEELNDDESFTEILTKVWRDYEVTGNGYLEVSRTLDGKIGYIGHINSQTVRIRRDRDGFVQISGRKAEFFRNFGDLDTPNQIGSGEPNEIIHVKKYTPTNAYYGVPDILAAEQAIAGNEFAARFNLDYFENKAVPRHLIILKGAEVDGQTERKILEFFETSLKGQNHRSMFIPLPAESPDRKISLEVEPIEAGKQDSSFTNYVENNRKEILMSHRVPLTKVAITENVNVAAALDSSRTFKEQVCGPEQDMIEKKLNRIVSEITDVFVLELNEMTLTDADTQSKINERNRKSGIVTANEVRAMEGWPRIEGGDELFDMNKKSGEARSNATANRERDSARSANATDSNGESRNAQGEGRTDGTE